MKLAWLGLGAALLLPAADLRGPRDRQDKAALQSAVNALAEAAQKSPDQPAAQYQLALAASYLSEVLLELGDRPGARTAAEAGIQAAERAAALQPASAANHRLLGTLCGQVIPANALAALRYGRCAVDSINKALELDPKSSDAWLSRGIGNYYLPPAFGGGPEKAVQDLRQAVQLNPKSADAHLWLGIALRKLGRSGEARAAIERSLALNPNRVWAKQQLAKTPAS
ncbi:MAG: tetratricopeptide repeat protein [Bryobacterales bacterium]|mgnify:CR=1 FL=1|nr:tetratricopeptide repeat protein [Bryobacterales bacterium]